MIAEREIDASNKPCTIGSWARIWRARQGLTANSTWAS